MYSKTETNTSQLRTIPSVSSDQLKNQYMKSKEKIAKEILLMNKDTKNEVQSALNKYTFSNEVFIPTPLRITKKEYFGKDYLLNNLVDFERNSLQKKQLIEPLNTETKRFAKQYKLIMDENQDHQMNYLGNLQKFYKGKGYKLNGVGNIKEIFKPSFLLDNNFGINIVDDAFRYGYKENKTEFHSDGDLMKKWENGINETKENRNKLSKVYEEKDINSIFERDADINKKKLELEEERANQEFQQKIQSIKQKLLEENKIKNMTRKEYIKYSSDLKEEINKTKKTIEDLSSTDTTFTKSNRIILKNLPKNVIHKTYKIIHPTHNKNYKQKIVFSSINKINKTTEENSASKLNIKSLKSSPKKSSDFFISLDQDKEKNNIKRLLPKIEITTSEEKNQNSKEKSKDQKGRNIKTKKQLKELNDLYFMVSNNKESFFEKYPFNSVEKYFKKYTKKRLPILIVKKGSNVKGIFDDFQQIVNKKNFNKVAKSSNDIKKQFGNNKNSAFNKNEYTNYFDVDKIEEIDEKIPIMHYLFAEELMSKKSSNDQ